MFRTEGKQPIPKKDLKGKFVSKERLSKLRGLALGGKNRETGTE
jgi:hypothetical protein